MSQFRLWREPRCAAKEAVLPQEPLAFCQRKGSISLLFDSKAKSDHFITICNLNVFFMYGNMIYLGLYDL